MPRSSSVTQVVGGVTVKVSTTDTTPVGDDLIEASGGPERGHLRLSDAELTAFRNLATVLVAKARAAVLP